MIAFRLSGRRARLGSLCALLLAALMSATAPQAQTRLVVAVPETTAQISGRVSIRPAEPWLHGLSSIHTDDGQRFVALSNFGYVIHGRFERDGAGRLTGFRPEQAIPLTFPDGRPLTNGFRAAEGLAVARDGRIFVSFEYHTRVWTYRSPGAPPEDLGVHGDFARLPNGRGLEALALAPNGDLYAIPERPARLTHGFPSYRWHRGEWVGSFRMPSDERFLPVSADFGPDGLLYVLEYDSGGGGGAVAQIRRFAVQGDRMGPGTVVLRSAPGQFGRVSGLSVWRDRGGRLRAMMVTNNGGLPDRAGELVEVLLAR